MQMKIWRNICIISVLVSFVAVSAVSGDEGKLSGLSISDYYYMAANHNNDLESRNGFWLRRIYLTYDQKLNEGFTNRVRFDMNSPDGLSDGAVGKIKPVIKDAYLKWSPKGAHNDIYLGISGTPTFSVIEPLWGYRSVERTLLDLQKLGSTRDFGVAVKGIVPGSDILSYHAMVGNGASIGTEINKYKKVYFSAGLKPSLGLNAQGYFDFETRTANSDRITLMGILAYTHEKYRVGGQFVHQIEKHDEGKDDITVQGLSVFGAAAISPDKAWLFVRVDRMFDPNPSGPSISYVPMSGVAKSNTIIAGIDLSPAKNVHIIPNVFVVVYDGLDAGDKPDMDIMPRVTLFLSF